MEQVHLYKGEVAVMAGSEADHFFLVRHGRLTRADIDDRSQDYAENDMLGVVNVLRCLRSMRSLRSVPSDRSVRAVRAIRSLHVPPCASPSGHVSSHLGSGFGVDQGSG